MVGFKAAILARYLPGHYPDGSAALLCASSSDVLLTVERFWKTLGRVGLPDFCRLVKNRRRKRRGGQSDGLPVTASAGHRVLPGNAHVVSDRRKSMDAAML